ncbi:MAG: hypothetical protein H0T76_23060 [Nannocystis sp.]|nr:hypothetical protein [Nannocystis sp.]MBA3549364.1 hypothetical protein [Nannocystis sp.]
MPRAPRLTAFALSATVLFACGGTPSDTGAPAQPSKEQPAVTVAPVPPDPLALKVAQFAPAELYVDIDHLSPAEQATLDKLVTAARKMEPIFDRQSWAGNPALRERIIKEGNPFKLEYFDIMRGPWDRQDHFAPFATEYPHPPGAGFYPEDLSVDDFKRWISDHPADKAAFESLTTVIRRTSTGLTAVPYSEAYREWLGPAAELLRQAAATTENKSLKKFLESRAAAFASDDYYQSDKDWMDLDSPVEITIGPYETYEDELLGLKASFEAFVTVSDPKASADLARFKNYLPDMEQHLPIPDELKTKRGSESPIRVVDLVYSSGEARKSVQTIAFNLPNDEKVRAEKGAKKVLLRNLIATKFNIIMRKIGEQVLDGSQIRFLDDQAFFQEVLFHELSHSLGPAFTQKDGKKVDVRVALEASYAALEEAKADVMGAYNVLYMIERGEFPKDMREKLLISYFAGLFRSVRFGVAEAHGKGAALQINRLVEAGAATVDTASGKFKVDLDKLEAAISDLVRDICVIQHAGDKAAADALLAKYGVVSPAMQRTLDSFAGIPVDIRPLYPIAGEILPK